MNIDEEDYLAHYGTPRHSGRYPWGSGGWGDGDTSQKPRNMSFLDNVKDLRSQGLSDPQIAKGMGMSTTEFRAKNTIARNEKKQADINMALRLRDKAYSNVAAAARMGIPESTYRALIKPGEKDKADVLTNTANMLKSEVDAKKMVDVGKGVESYLNISKEKLDVAVAMLKEQGYTVHTFPEPQIATGHDTQKKVLALPGTTQRDVFTNRGDVKQLSVVSSDFGRTYTKMHDPISISPDRVDVRYRGEGGEKTDGVIYVRHGVEDVSLGNARYAQVRIKVGNEHYLKGMAMYKDNLPEGIDLLFNTNKERTGNKLDAMKPMSENSPDLPFGAVVNQIFKDEGTDHARVTSAMNLVNEEGNWLGWSKSISSQVLSKQPLSLAKSQLDKTYEARKRTLDEINALTNPVVKKTLLHSFAEGTDAAAVQLNAASLTRRDSWNAILPIESMSPNEVYAPRFRHGERVVLIRYPHGGTFEIPELTVNNNQREARGLLGDVPDVVGINHEVAQRLSGADFDGDTVLVIPNNQRKIKTSPALEGLKSFDPVAAYPAYPGMIPIGKRKQQEMGNISNLITDMTIRGAPHDHIAQAVRHSMVIIDADKKNLNYKQSAIDNGIAALKQEYQGKHQVGGRSGASTIISRAGAQAHVPEKKPRPQSQGGPIDEATGRKVFVDTGKMIVKKGGKVELKTQRSKKLAETDDAHTLSSGTPMERLYADHSNKLKALANEARLAQINAPTLKYSPSAKKAYEKEVASLNSKLTIAKRNAPLERQAQAIANSVTRTKRARNPDLEPGKRKEIALKDLEQARARLGASKKIRQVQITESEWNAIQAGAITNHKLEQILANTDLEEVRKLATPRRVHLMTNPKIARARSMLESGATRAQVADQLGVSLTTLDTALKGA